jgi:hypothetical protein
MPETKIKAPQWGPIADPAPWPTYDPIPWPWKHVPFPHGDPIPWPLKVLERIRIEDVIALRQVQLEAINDVFQAQVKAEKTKLAKQQEILAKYK